MSGGNPARDGTVGREQIDQQHKETDGLLQLRKDVDALRKRIDGDVEDSKQRMAQLEMENVRLKRELNDLKRTLMEMAVERTALRDEIRVSVFTVRKHERD
jgi:septal ring factor EnvC (AmiA/AmiB activator)